MRFMIGAAVAYLLYGGYLVARRRPRLLPLWLAALITWFTLCKYLICTRCERYGEACDFFYLGKLAALMFPAQPDRTLTKVGIAAEGGSVAVLQLLPVLAGLRRPRSLLLYLLLLGVGEGAQLNTCCRRCIKYSRDWWKRDVCPSYRLAQKLFGEEDAV